MVEKWSEISRKRKPEAEERMFVPNAETIAAMKEARAGNLKSFDSVEALMNDLHAAIDAEAQKTEK